MPSGAEFEATRQSLRLWRAVEAQQVVSTMLLVDTLDEQALLEQLIDTTKPPVPPEASGLHYLLFTPFRYPPAGYGSRFRRPGDPGVFYGADAIRTACAEVGYWRWRFLRDSPELERIDPRPQTVFQAAVRAPTIDLREVPLVRKRARWTRPNDYGPCQDLAARARHAGVGVIRYESVRDPDQGGAAAVLSARAFARPAPLAVETWYLGTDRARVRWTRAPFTGRPEGFEFDTAPWARTLPGPPVTG
ncbi:MAG: RES family NAD+ phosphorylase [Gemmatimonadales bacterium]